MEGGGVGGNHAGSGDPVRGRFLLPSHSPTEPRAGPQEGAVSGAVRAWEEDMPGLQGIRGVM